MKKISYYLILIVAVGTALIAYWVYSRYVREEAPQLLFFKVERGDLREVVKVRGEVAPQKEFDLEFPFSGIIEKIFAKEGQEVKEDEPLMKLETTDLALEINRLKAQSARAEAGKENAEVQLEQYQAAMESQQAKLDELKRGTRPEEIQIAETKVSNAQKSLADAEINLTNVKNKATVDLANLYDEVKNILNDAYVKADDAVNKQADEMFSNDTSSNPQLTFLVSDIQAETDSESQRVSAGNALKAFKLELDNLSSEQSALDQALINGEKHLTTVRDFLARLTDAVNSAANLPASTVATYKANVNTGRTNVNTAFSNISSQKQLIAAQKAADQSNIASAEAKVNDASNSLKSAEDDLALKKAGTTAEQIAAQEAQVKQALANVSGQRALIKQAEADIASVKAQIDATQEKIKKSTLRAPAPAKIVKIFLEKREVFKPGQSAVSLSTSGYKLQADVSELDIGKIRDINGNEVLIRLDAFSGKEFKGRVVLIEQKEIIKEGDKYYRVNIYFEDQATGARSGMSGDLIIQISFKENALKIPELAVYKKGETKFVKIFEDGRQREAEIETGASDGEFIEVVKGLSEGQTIAVNAD